MKLQIRSKRPKNINQILCILLCLMLAILPWVLNKQEMNWVVDLFWDKEF